MKYKGINIKEMNIVVFLGEDFIDKDWRENQDYFGEKIKDLNFKEGFNYECPIEDMVWVYLNYKDDFKPIAKESTIDLIFNCYNELMKVFKDIKVEFYLNGFLEDEGNSVMLDIKEFVDYLLDEAIEYERLNK